MNTWKQSLHTNLRPERNTSMACHKVKYDGVTFAPRWYGEQVWERHLSITPSAGEHHVSTEPNQYAIHISMLHFSSSHFLSPCMWARNTPSYICLFALLSHCYKYGNNTENFCLKVCEHPLHRLVINSYMVYQVIQKVHLRCNRKWSVLRSGIYLKVYSSMMKNSWCMVRGLSMKGGLSLLVCL